MTLREAYVFGLTMARQERANARFNVLTDRDASIIDMHEQRADALDVLLDVVARVVAEDASFPTTGGTP